MSMPTIPNLDGSIHVTRSQAKTLLLVSIGMEELALAHILNTEGEKVQYVLGNNPTFEQILAINSSVQSTLKDIIKKEMLLEFKLEEVEKLAEGDA